MTYITLHYFCCEHYLAKVLYLGNRLDFKTLKETVNLLLHLRADSNIIGFNLVNSNHMFRVLNRR